MLSIHRGGVNFNYLPLRGGGGGALKIFKKWGEGGGGGGGGDLKIFKKWVEVWCRGQMFSKGERAGTFPYSIFSRFISFTFRHFTLPFANLCYAFEEKLFFSATIILCNKAILR